MPKYILTKAPAPLAWGPQSGQPLLGTARAIAMPANAPHPDAARAFIDFWLSKQAMGMLANNVGEYVLEKGVFPPIHGIEKVKVQPVRDLTDDEIKHCGSNFGLNGSES